jgi:hypothetical protein
MGDLFVLKVVGGVGLRGWKITRSFFGGRGRGFDVGPFFYKMSI